MILFVSKLTVDATQVIKGSVVDEIDNCPQTYLGRSSLDFHV